MWPTRFKQYSIVKQQENHIHQSDATNFDFTIPRELHICQKFTSDSLFHGGTDSPTLSAIDPLSKQSVYITKYLCLQSKSIPQQYLSHLYERILLTSQLAHPNVHRILSWYIADACLYSITGIIPRTLRQAIQSEKFAIERVRQLAFQIISGTIYLQSKGLCPLTPWYTTNIELTADDRIRLCSPTISTTKLNGRVLQYHHLWRHAPECLIRMICNQDSHGLLDSSKEDVWSIACIIIEMLINTIPFRPQNDDPSLQLLCIVQLVGGLTSSLVNYFPSHIQTLFANLSLDPHQHRLERLLKQIFTRYSQSIDEDLFDLLKSMLQFQSANRLELAQLVHQRFFSQHAAKPSRSHLCKKNLRSTVHADDLIQLCARLQLDNSRWLLTLKEICLFRVLLQTKKIQACGLNSSLENQFEQLITFLNGNRR